MELFNCQTTVHLKYFDNYTWEEVGAKLSGGGESVRKELERYLKDGDC